MNYYVNILFIGFLMRNVMMVWKKHRYVHVWLHKLISGTCNWKMVFGSPFKDDIAFFFKWTTYIAIYHYVNIWIIM